MTEKPSFILETTFGEIPLLCNAAATPRTVAALAAAAPLEVQIHTPKIAGNHIYWHAPFICDLEGSADVMAMDAGAFFYWPERQFLEIAFAPLQAETATVTPLGRADCPVELLVALGERVRLTQGQVINPGTLRALHPAAGAQAEDASPLAAVRRKLWAAMPAEIEHLPARSGIMHPIGPIVFAEAEARTFHELLWWLRKSIGDAGEGAIRTAAAIATEKAATRLHDFCHLPESAAALRQVSAALRDEAQAIPAVLDEAILIAGRISAWIDLVIRWNDLNEALNRQPLQQQEEAFA